MTTFDESPQEVHRALGWHVAWVFVFLANLPLPLLMGFDLYRNAQAGIITAILVAVLLGHGAVACFSWLRAALIISGCVTALLQFLFIPHLVVGLIAAGIVERFQRDLNSFAGGFWLTLTTGALLLAPAITCALVLHSSALIANCFRRDPD